MEELEQLDQKDILSRPKLKSKSIGIRLFVIDSILVLAILLTNVYLRSVSTVKVVATATGEQISVVKRYYEYFGIITIVSIVSLALILVISLYFLVKEHRIAVQRLEQLATAFTNIGIAKVTITNQIFTDEDLRIINAWNDSVELIEKQVNDREKYLKAMIHDFKTPIQIIKSNIQLHNVKLGTNQYVEAVNDEVSDLERNVLNYLVVEKINHFEQVTITELNTSTFFKQIVDKYSKLQYTINLKFLLEVKLQTDINMFTKIIDNIIENGMKHGSENQLEVVIEENTISFINKIDCVPFTNNIFEGEQRHLSSNGNGLGVEIIKTYCKLLNYDISSSIKENQFIVTLKLK